MQQQSNVSDQIKKYLEQRKAQLQNLFSSLNIVQQLKKFQKQVYYYQTQIQQYRQILEDPPKWEN